jgi:hypothetical protein
LLLANLIRQRAYPRFIPDAVVRHSVRLSPKQYLLKAFRKGFIEAKTYAIIEGLGVSIRSSSMRRVEILFSMLKYSLKSRLGVIPFLIVMARQCISLLAGALQKCGGDSIVNICGGVHNERYESSAIEPIILESANRD